MLLLLLLLLRLGETAVTGDSAAVRASLTRALLAASTPPTPVPGPASTVLVAVVRAGSAVAVAADCADGLLFWPAGSATRQLTPGNGTAMWLQTDAVGEYVLRCGGGGKGGARGRRWLPSSGYSRNSTMVVGTEGGAAAARRLKYIAVMFPRPGERATLLDYTRASFSPGSMADRVTETTAAPAATADTLPVP